MAMRQPTFVGSSITTRGGDAKTHDRMLPVAPIEPAELLLGTSQADLETFDLAEPAFRLGFGDSGDQVVADLGKPCPLGGVRSEERASDASVLMNAWVPKTRAQVPMDTFRFSKCARKASHSSSVGIRYSSLGRADRRRAMNARWASIVSAGETTNGGDGYWNRRNASVTPKAEPAIPHRR